VLSYELQNTINPGIQWIGGTLMVVADFPSCIAIPLLCTIIVHAAINKHQEIHEYLLEITPIVPSRAPAMNDITCRRSPARDQF
jgi:hypothetical protein